MRAAEPCHEADVDHPPSVPAMSASEPGSTNPSHAGAAIEVVAGRNPPALRSCRSTPAFTPPIRTAYGTAIIAPVTMRLTPMSSTLRAVALAPTASIATATAPIVSIPNRTPTTPAPRPSTGPPDPVAPTETA